MTVQKHTKSRVLDFENVTNYVTQDVKVDVVTHTGAFIKKNNTINVLSL